MCIPQAKRCEQDYSSAKIRPFKSTVTVQHQQLLKVIFYFLPLFLTAFLLLTQSFCGQIVWVHPGFRADPVNMCPPAAEATQQLGTARIHSDKDSCVLTWTE